MSFENDIAIDLDSLETEWAKQPRLFFRYAKMEAEKRKVRDDLALQEKVLCAQIAKRVRDNPARYGVEKLSEGSVKEAVNEHPKVIALRQAINTAEYELHVTEGAVKSMDQKKRALEAHVRLLVMEYFSGPETPHSIKDIKARVKKEITGEIASRLNNLPGDEDDPS